MNINWKKIEKEIGSLKFAVIIISLLTISMIVGTFLESYYGTDFANRMIYKTIWFMGIQFFIFLSIVFAATLRLPPQKRLYGFYTIHSGLIIIGIGSLVTYISGIDGQIFLAPNESTNKIILSNDVLKVTYPNDGKQYTYNLPFSGFSKSLNINLDDLNFTKFVPFAIGKLSWMNSTSKDLPKSAQSSHYYFKNAFAEQDFTLTLHPEASNEFQSTFTMGPLSVNYLPQNIADCFAKESPSKLLFWNTANSECFTAEEKKIVIKKTSSNHRYAVLPVNQGYLTFFPDFSPYPLDSSFKPNEQSPIKAFSKSLFESKPALFLFGPKASYFDKNSKKWVVENLELNGKPLVLPWMSAEISLLAHETEKVPFNVPVPVVPIQKNGNLIKGELRAVEVNILGNNYWVTNTSPLSLLIKGKKVIIEVTKETVNLPFELTLTEFKMDKDPGTNNPASYESFVKLFTGKTNTKHHIYMNNPLKHDGFTFYQASYSQDDQGNYSSTLSVNVDQGRPLKYLGSLMLVFGSIWHYNLNKKKKKKEEIS
jgi:hypothetical protein